MIFQSPLEDFVLNSLSAVRGVLDKLDYVAGLRRDDGTYDHWGLARVHGENAAHLAAWEAHRRLFSKVLSTPLGHLLEEVASSQLAASLGLDPYLEYLSQRSSLLAPQGAERGPVLHLNSVLHALSALARARNRTSPQAS